MKKWERFHGRILDFIPAQPADLKDAQQLAKLRAGDITIADDLLGDIVTAAKGSARRIVVNIERVRQFARTQGLRTVARTEWGERELFVGEAPRRQLPGR